MTSPTKALEAVLAGSVGLSFTGGNALEILEDEQSLRRLEEDIRSAHDSVTFQVYYIEKGGVLDRFTKLFRERAEAGVRVFLLLDAFGTKRLSQKAVQHLVGPRVRVARLRPDRLRHPLRFLHRAHCRTCVIDGSVAYTGGFGLADKWDPSPGQGPTWRELAVRVAGPVALRLQSGFTVLWAEALGGEVLKGKALAPPEAVESRGDTLAGVLFSYSATHVSEALRFLDVLCTEAKQRLWITSGYFAPSPDLRRLLESAARRGVDVRILTANQSTDLPVVHITGRGNYPPLLEAGVRIWEFQPRMLHAKAFIMDDRLMGIGTLNVDPASAKLNDESMVIALDAQLTRALAQIFERDLGQSLEITDTVLAAEPFNRRLLARLCAPLVRLP